MNHGPKFQKLMRDIKADVANMQARGYYGDGFWSDGKRLKDSVKMGAEGVSALSSRLPIEVFQLMSGEPSDLPEYICGVTAG